MNAHKREQIFARLAAHIENPVSDLAFSSNFELLISVLLSAQATDAGVNLVTPALFARFPDAATQAAASEDEVQELIGSLPMFRNKSRSVVRCAGQLVERHGGEVPGDMKDLVALAGVGRKTANLVRSVALGLPGLPVDTHVLRLSKRVGLTDLEDPGGGVGPMQAKKETASAIVALLRGARAAAAARAHFERVVQRGEAPEQVERLAAAPLLALIVLARGCSKGAARRLLEQGAAGECGDGVHG